MSVFMYDAVTTVPLAITNIDAYLEWVEQTMEADAWDALETHVLQERSELVNHARYIEDGEVHAIRFFSTEAAATASLEATRNLSTLSATTFSEVTEVTENDMASYMLRNMNGL